MTVKMDNACERRICSIDGKAERMDLKDVYGEKRDFDRAFEDKLYVLSL